MLKQGGDKTQICQKVVACMDGKAEGFALQMYETAAMQGDQNGRLYEWQRM